MGWVGWGGEGGGGCLGVSERHVQVGQLLVVTGYRGGVKDSTPNEKGSRSQIQGIRVGHTQVGRKGVAGWGGWGLVRRPGT